MRQGNKYGILIGIDDQDPEGLHYCSKDVDDLYKVLISHCGFSPKNIIKIQSPYKNEVPLSHIILDNTIERLQKEYQINSSDTLFFYFSGHGEFDDSKQASYLVFPKERVSTNKIKGYIDKLHAKKTIIVFDACFVGAKILSKSFSISKLRRKLHIDSEGTFGIYASPTERVAYMPDDLSNSLFTRCFIDGILDEKNYDQNGLLSIDMLASVCSREVYARSIKLVSAKKIDKEQIIVREGRIEGYFSFAELPIISNQAAKSNINNKLVTNGINTPSKDKPLEPEGIDSNNSPEIKAFQSKLAKVKNNLNNFEDVISSYIISYEYGKPYSPNRENHGGKIDKALRSGYIDEDGDPVRRQPMVKSLIEALEDFTTYIIDNNRSEYFYNYFNDEFGYSPKDYDTQPFWENVYKLNVPEY
ncbi:caspase family protein [Cesiribacter sp. SM1]|uniref:caspase family protein n=1 Tax=Cesiribacter sp. SM1 TaxID=2861196 RepID=UPI001CD6F34C|nr:caspase family protein [Cesiribacter sp. SM1]